MSKLTFLSTFKVLFKDFGHSEPTSLKVITRPVRELRVAKVTCKMHRSLVQCTDSQQVTGTVNRSLVQCTDSAQVIFGDRCAHCTVYSKSYRRL